MVLRRLDRDDRRARSTVLIFENRELIRLAQTRVRLDKLDSDIAVRAGDSHVGRRIRACRIQARHRFEVPRSVES